MRQPERKGHSLRAWEEEWRRAIFGRSVCTLHFSTNDERLIPTNGLAWCRHARPVWGRKSGCTVYLVVDVYTRYMTYPLAGKGYWKGW